MSLFHYIGAPRELPLGQRGGRRSEEHIQNHSSPIIMFRDGRHPMIPLERFIADSEIKEEEIEVYDSLVDLAGVYIMPIHNGNKDIKKHFTNPFVYQIAASWGSFQLNSMLKDSYPDDYKVNVRCMEVLAQLIRDYGAEGEVFELYSSWADEEYKDKDRSLTQVLDLKCIAVLEHFELIDRQYIQVKL